MTQTKSYTVSMLVFLTIIALQLGGCGGGSGGSSANSSPAQVSISISPVSATVATGQSQTFTATVLNTSNTGVTWSVQEGSTGGTVSNGTYTAPNKVGTYHLVVTSVADATKSAMATITVTGPAPTFSSNPPVMAMEGAQYSYVVSATDPANSGVSFQLTSGPTGAYVSGSTLAWTPTAQQSRTANQFTITATTGLGGTATQSWSITPAGTIRGTRMFTFISDAGEISLPDDTTKFPIVAWVPNGSGGFARIDGTGSPNGTFSVPGVPVGYYWLEHGTANYFWTKTSTIDTGYDVLGRSDASLPTLSTYLNFSLGLLTSWQTADDLQIFVPNTGAWDNTYYKYMYAGATAATFSVPWNMPLSSAFRGDQAYVTQLVTKYLYGIRVQVLENIFGPVPFSQQNGMTTTLQGNFRTLPPTNSVRANIRGSSFSQYVASTGAGAVDDYTGVYLDLLPNPVSKGWIGAAPDIIEYNGIDGPLTTDVDLGDIAYPNPFPTSWQPFIIYYHYASVQYAAPGATTNVIVRPVLALFTTKLPTVTEPIQATISPATNPTINGKSLLAAQTSVGLTPTVAWGPPSLGTPSGYTVSIRQLYASGTQSQISTVAVLRTKTSSIQVPPDILQAGNTYVLSITAYDQPGVDFELAPYRRSLPQAYAQFYSGTLRP